NKQFPEVERCHDLTNRLAGINQRHLSFFFSQLFVIFKLVSQVQAEVTDILPVVAVLNITVRLIKIIFYRTAENIFNTQRYIETMFQERSFGTQARTKAGRPFALREVARTVIASVDI